MDKNMKTYLRAVKRRLNMPKELKNRVMADFTGSIEARIEDGQNLQTIFAELGTPKQAAKDLNQQMKAYTYRKSPWRWGCLALSVVSTLCLAYRGLPGLLLMLFNKANNAATVGIIGGADGPTAIFVTGNTNAPFPSATLYILLILMGIIGFIALGKLKQD